VIYKFYNIMKNEPVVSYDHMQEDSSLHQDIKDHVNSKVSTYFIDTVLIAVIAFAVITILF